ncbi:uncharacterized protein ARMOST_06257 [Armillaria ostoyae]|uniref:Uncharacterized protein n=1 Tax=Armillaria ostoyae TaxID=47428 RepID=A0A284R2J3_ARMOS|nr:uncharacterized protein ARMOST_06257 [Armillaria ostoyae]
MPSPYDRVTDPTWMELTYNDFDHFCYNKETFGGYTPKLSRDYRAPPIPEWRKLLHERTDWYSVPRPPIKWRRPDLPLNPISWYAEDAPHLEIKLMLLVPLKPFKGEHDDIEWFTGNCITYFEVFASYFQLCS